MDVLDKLKQTIKQKAIPRIPMKVCMMGPRAVGKTTILTAVFNDTQENLGFSTNLILKAEGDTLIELTGRKHQLNSIFADKIQITDKPSAGLAATSTVNTFDFVFGLKGKEPRIDLQIKDFPGEYVLERPNEVKSYINESSAVLVAIDTPHLMEEDGIYCEVKNRASVITNFFKTQKLNGEKLVLLVPLKCERYFFENKMDDVLHRIETVYSDLLTDFRNSGMVACAVTPILTLGAVEYDRMKMADGKISLNMNGCPEEVIYRFRGNKPKYSPAFCVQPLYYLLSFLAAQYGREKKNRSIIDKIFTSIYSLFDNDQALFDEILKMEKNRKTDLPGYEVECGADLFKFCK